MPDLLEVRPAEAILQALDAFHWKGDNREKGWDMRESLSKSLIAALDADDSGKLSEALADIHTWGLPGGLPASVRGGSTQVLELLKRVRGDGLNTEILAELLSLDQVGIATVSKWICLLNQERFAILDSRVSVALRELRKDGLRFLPILPRRKKLDHTPWPEDYFPPAVKAASMASYYLRYLALMRDAAHTLKLKPAEVEMALFMMGDVTCPNPKEWKKKRGALNAV